MITEFLVTLYNIIQSSNCLQKIVKKLLFMFVLCFLSCRCKLQNVGQTIADMRSKRSLAKCQLSDHVKQWSSTCTNWK